MAVRSSPGRGHRYLTTEARAQHTLFNFGEGLSYTSWATAVVSVSPPSSINVPALLSGGNVTMLLRIGNTGGEYTGSRVVYVFLSRVNPVEEEEWPVQWLPVHGFTKVHDVVPGDSREVTLTLTARDFSRWKNDRASFVVQPGDYSISVRDFNGTLNFTVSASASDTQHPG